MVKKLLFLLLTVSAVYGQDLQTGVTFVDGTTVHAADLNNAVNSATILAGFLSSKGSATPLTTDKFLFHQASSSSLKVVTLADMLTAGNAVNSTTSRSANTVFAAPSGASGAPTFRLLSPADTSIATNSAGGTSIDCSIARTFSRTLAANTTYTITNISDGATATAAVQQAASGAPYTTPFAVAGGRTWKGGFAPTQTTTANKTDLYTFIHIGSAVYGSASQNY